MKCETGVWSKMRIMKVDLEVWELTKPAGISPWSPSRVLLSQEDNRDCQLSARVQSCREVARSFVKVAVQMAWFRRINGRREEKGLFFVDSPKLSPRMRVAVSEIKKSDKTKLYFHFHIISSSNCLFMIEFTHYEIRVISFHFSLTTSLYALLNTDST